MTPGRCAWVGLGAFIALSASACGRLGFEALAPDTDADAGETLALDAPAEINLGARATLSARGGTPPYTYSLTSGAGFLETNVFVAPNRAGTSTLEVTDAALDTAQVQIIYRGSTLFMAGGLVGGNEVATVMSSTDGVTWSVVGALPAPRANGALVAFDDRLLYLGGSIGSVTDTIFESTDGSVWTQSGTLPGIVVSTAVTVHEGALWLISGYNGTSDRGEVYRSTNGTTWSAVGTFPTPRHEHDVISRDGKLFVFGGHSSVLGNMSDVVRSPDGSTWTTTSATLSFATDFQGMGELGNRVIRACGISCGEVETSTDLVTWQSATLPGGGRDGPAMIAFDGRMLLLGGGGTAILASTDGLTWMSVGTFPTLITRSSVAQFTPR